MCFQDKSTSPPPPEFCKTLQLSLPERDLEKTLQERDLQQSLRERNLQQSLPERDLQHTLQDRDLDESTQERDFRQSLQERYPQHTLQQRDLQQSLQDRDLQQSMQERDQHQSMQQRDNILRSLENNDSKPPPSENNLKKTGNQVKSIVEGESRIDYCEERVLSGKLKEGKDIQMFAQLTTQDRRKKFLSRKENGIPMNSNKNSLTPRSRSKFEHLIKNLRESNEDEQLVIYKVLECQHSSALNNKLKITEVVPYKGEPKV